jgi:hypothetical protein
MTSLAVALKDEIRRLARKEIKQQTGSTAQAVARYLRIAFSATCGILCLLLIVLWVRSYYSEDILNFTLPSRGFTAWSLEGKAVLTSGANPGNFSVNSFPADQPIVGTGLPENDIGLGFGGVSWPGGFFVTFPCWFPVLFSATFAVAPWAGSIPYRFSLRTLLIGMTVIAVVLGIVAASR